MSFGLLAESGPLWSPQHLRRAKAEAGCGSKNRSLIETRCHRKAQPMLEILIRGHEAGRDGWCWLEGCMKGEL